MENLTENKIELFENVLQNYNPKNNVSSYKISKYERAKILGIRAQQLAEGAIPCVDIKKLNKKYNNKIDVEIIARQELLEKTMPLMLCRRLPNGTKEYWRICDMTD